MKKFSHIPTWRIAKKKPDELVKIKEEMVAPKDTKLRVCAVVNSTLRLEWFGEWPEWKGRMAIFHDAGKVIANQLTKDQTMVFEYEDKKYYATSKLTYLVALADVLFHNAAGVGQEVSIDKKDVLRVNLLRKALNALEEADACCSQPSPLWSKRSGLAIKINQILDDINTAHLPEDTDSTDKPVLKAEVPARRADVFMSVQQPQTRVPFEPHPSVEDDAVPEVINQPPVTALPVELPKLSTVKSSVNATPIGFETIPALQLDPLSTIEPLKVKWPDKPVSKSSNTLVKASYLDLLQPQDVSFLTAANLRSSSVDLNALRTKPIHDPTRMLVSEEDIALLLKHEYAHEEIQMMLGLGATPMVLKKLVSRGQEKFDTEESVACIETCVAMGTKEAEKAQQKDLLLVIGNTGVGKSTAVNYLHGCSMQREMRNGRPVILCDPKGDKSEVALIGHTNSKTFVPMVIDSPETGINFCDCPGFFDRRGAEIDISNAVNVKNMIKAAKSVKVLLLIHYRDSVDPRGVGLNILLETLKNLFGMVDVERDLKLYTDNILIGITQAPISIDDYPVSFEYIVEQICGEGKFPAELQQRILVLDPLGRRDKEGCHRTDWLKKIINDTRPIQNPRDVFKTVLSPANELKLIEISRQISSDINNALSAHDFPRAYHHLRNMGYLMIIERDEIKTLFSGNVEVLNTHYSKEDACIRELCRRNDFDAAGQALLELRVFCTLFEEFNPVFTEKFMALVDFSDAQRIDRMNTELDQCLSAVTDAFLKDDEQLKLNAYKTHQLCSQADAAEESGEFDQYLQSFLRIISDWQKIGDSARALDAKLVQMASLCLAMGKADFYKAGEQRCLQQIKLIRVAAKKAHEDSTRQQLLVLVIEINEQLKWLDGACDWHTVGEAMLQALLPLRNTQTLGDMASIMQSLAQIQGLESCATSLLEKVQCSQTLFETLDDPNQFDGVSKPLHTALSAIVHKLEESRNEDKKLKHAKLEQEMAERVTRSFLQTLSEQNFESAKQHIAFMTSMSAAQKEQLKKNREFDPALKVQLNSLLNELKGAVTWESHGQSLLEPCGKGVSGLSEILAVYRNMGSEGQAMALLVRKLADVMMLANSLQTSLGLAETSTYSSLIANALQEVFARLSRAKQEQEAKEAEAKRQSDAEALSAQINNDLLPNSKFKQLREAFQRLEVLAPSHVKLIPLENTVKQHLQEFNDNLLSKNYQPAIDKLRLLRELQKEMGSILQRMSIVVDIAKLQSDIIEHIISIYKAVADEATDAFSSDSIKDVRAPLKSLTKVGDFFEAIQKFNSTESVIAIREQMRDAIRDALMHAFKDHGRSNDPQIYAKLLMQTQFLITEIGPRDAKLSTLINDWLIEDTKKRGQDFLSAVGIILMQQADDASSFSRYANELIGRHAVFKEARTGKFMEETKGRTSKNILSELQVPNINTLEQAYHCFEKAYWSIIQSMKEASDRSAEVQQLLETTIGNSRSKGSVLANCSKLHEKPDVLALLLADTCAIWSYLEAGERALTDATIIRTPHSAQVIAIFLLLGLDDTKGIRNHLIQVLTGEGKSVIIAFCSIVLALIGYKVDVACYTPYLASRDEKSFEHLFRRFEVSDSVAYGDLSDLSNNFITRKIGDIRDMAESFLAGKTVSSRSISSKKQILVFDEADVPYSENFLGRTYNPSTRLQSKSYRKLLESIWESRQEYSSLAKDQFISKMVNHELMDQFVKDYPGTKELLNGLATEIYDGFVAVNNGSHKYECIGGKIGYRDESANTIRFTTVHSCKTSFAAIKEVKEQRVNEYELDRYVSPSLCVGRIAFSLLPADYDNVIGVSGTLPFSGFQKKLLENYNILSLTKIPSVFTKKPVTDLGAVICAGDLDENKSGAYFYTIKKETEEAISQDRAVLIIFETESRLKDYEKFIRNHPYGLKSIKVNTLLIDTENRKRDTTISEAATRGKVTMVIREYGRGSDFVCNDSQLRNAGGVMVLCAFLPETESEATQIRGRTGRQNDPGSYKEILHLSDLGKYEIKTQTEVQEHAAGVRAYLIDKREKYNERKGATIEKDIQSAEASHHSTFEFAKILARMGSSSFFGGPTKPFSGSSTSEEQEAIAIIKKFNGY